MLMGANKTCDCVIDRFEDCCQKHARESFDLEKVRIVGVDG